MQDLSINLNQIKHQLLSYCNGGASLNRVSYLMVLIIGLLTVVNADAADNLKNNNKDIQLDLSDSSSWIIDTVHLGTKQLTIEYDAADEAVEILPTWSDKDVNSKVPGIQNVNHSKLHLYKLIDVCDCSQADSYFEINIPSAYINEGKMEFIFSLQAGAKGDYLFNGRTFTMSDFDVNNGQYTKLIVKAADFNEPEQKRRAIERINFIFHRNGSMLSAPIKIRHFSIDRNIEKISKPKNDIKIKNPKYYYKFTYNQQQMIDGIFPRISSEDMNITKQLNQSRDGMSLTPQWKEDEIPVGHSGKVTLVQPLGAIHDLEKFEIQYLINIPTAYFDEAKLDIYLFIQAGETGFDRWSGTQRPLLSFVNKGGQDHILTMTEKDFLHQGKKRNQIEVVGLQLNPHGSSVTEAITLKSITVKLPE